MALNGKLVLDQVGEWVDLAARVDAAIRTDSIELAGGAAALYGVAGSAAALLSG